MTPTTQPENYALTATALLFRAAQQRANKTQAETYVLWDLTTDDNLKLVVATPEELSTYHAHVPDSDIIAVFNPI